MFWHKDRRRITGGYWECLIHKREGDRRRKARRYAEDPAWAERERQRKGNWFRREFDSNFFFRAEYQLVNRRRMALHRKAKRHQLLKEERLGSLSEQGLN
jgi:hypothetical protein